MRPIVRRQFVKQSALFIASSTLPFGLRAWPGALGERQFKLSLNPGAIGVKTTQAQLLSIAVEHGFEAIIPFPKELAKMDKAQIGDLKQEMRSKDITWGSASLPLQFRNDEATFQKDLKALPALAEAVQRAGGTRMNTWIMPTHKTLSYLDNFKEHKKRLRQIGRIIGHFGLDLGLEYVGPKTLMARDRFAFIRTMKEVQALIEAIGLANVKIQLDSFHWFCAGESVADLLTLSKDDIVTVDLNDARAGFTADEQLDGKRELPLGSGVVDLKGFLGALVQIGYDGPIRAEPFNQPLRDMPDQEALKATYVAMRKAFDLV